MSNEISFPRLGWDMQEGVFGGWLIGDGDAVEEGQAIFTVESDKAGVDIEALDSGILCIDPTGPQQGDTVVVGTVIGYILDEKEGSDFQFPSQDAATDRTGIPTDDPSTNRSTAEISRNALQSTPTSGRLLITPMARKIARENKVDINRIRGTGRNGRIVLRDVETQAASSLSGTASLSSSRRITAERMARSSRETAPVTLFMEVDVSHLVQARNEFKQRDSENSLIPSYDDFFILFCARSLEKFPALNASFEGQSFVQHRDIHIGFAVDTGDRLLVPVIRDADQKKLSEITRLSAGLVDSARNGTISIRDIQGARFTITNLGAFDVFAFTPIINLPECAILGLGKISTRFEPQDEKAATFITRKIMMLSLTFDHRMVDGAEAARFLQHLKSLIENPISLIIT